MMPHIVCYLRDWYLAYLHVTCDVAIALAYLTIGVVLFRFRTLLADALGRRIFLLYSIFIPACGLTHVFDAIVVWVPMYWVQAGVKLATAIVSLQTAWLMLRLSKSFKSTNGR